MGHYVKSNKRGGQNEWGVVNFDKIKRKCLIVNMNTTIIRKKLITIQLIMLQYTVAKRLEMGININIETSYADDYTWIFISKIFRLPSEVTFFNFTSFFSSKWLTS